MAMIKVALPGAIVITEMDESELHKLEGTEDTPDALVHWTQYHLKSSGALVHRSAHAVIKQAAWDAKINL